MDDLVSASDELQGVYAALDAGAAAFNAGDVDGWMAGNHPEVRSFQGDHFVGMADFRASVAESQVAMSEGWDTIWREGVVEGDSACVWGEVDWPYRTEGERHVARMACSWYFVRLHGDWKTLFSHYTVLDDPRA